MNLRLFQAAILAMFILSANAAFGQKEKTVEVGGVPMYPSKNIVELSLKESWVAGKEAENHFFFNKFHLIRIFR